MTIDDTPRDLRPGLRPPRFKLGSVMWAFVLLGIAFALISYLGSHATLLILLFALAIAAHVAGNALGTQLRSNGDTPSSAAGESAAENPGRRLLPTDYAPATRLRSRDSLGRPIVFITLAGVLVGATVGGGGMLFLVPELSLGTLGSIALGMLAAGVLGGIWTFAATSFLQVACGALWQATREVKKRP